MANDFAADIDAIQGIDAVPRILEVVCRSTGMGFAGIARVTDHRWVCCAARDEIAFGLKPGSELKLDTTICNEIRLSHEAVVIEHVANDECFSGHPTPALYGFQSYISMPIILSDGSMFGTLCAIDPRPARLSPEIVQTFKLFAELIGSQLNSAQSLAASEAILLGERQVSDLREQFIAVLGHDLRNPLASMASGTRMMTRAKSEKEISDIAILMQTTINRMSRLIDNVLDFARGRLGGGLTLQRSTKEPIAQILDQVVAELRSSHLDRTIETNFNLTKTVNFDGQRIGQLFSNLLGNAITHGSQDKPIIVNAATHAGTFELSVANSGSPIPPAAMEKLFHPFYRGTVQQSLQGLGLGLYIASEIARAHGGTLDVTSSAAETRFTFRMPTT
ncbi:GAF domain-containing sensor histidine kinase [Bradyrhizobium sp.]|jgi:signal transduction histidine kinase|uniref:GAF domain-containing sensor histidine kinase n=1 Tax=Bradyrhizobium sp. TaxID=376 RepID=UPI003C23B6AA